MAWFRFVGESLLRLVKETSIKKDLQDGLVGVVKGVTGSVLQKLNSGKVEEAKAELTEAYKGAEAIAGAVVKNTPAENMVDQSIIHSPVNEQKASAEKEPELPKELEPKKAEPPKTPFPPPLQPQAKVEPPKGGHTGGHTAQHTPPDKRHK